MWSVWLASSIVDPFQSNDVIEVVESKDATRVPVIEEPVLSSTIPCVNVFPDNNRESDSPSKVCRTV